jgi:hypothetical protein
MPNVFSKFNNTLSVSNFTNLDNLLEGGTGDATFTNNADGTFQGFSTNTGPNLIPTTATLVGIQFFVSVTPSAGSLNFTFTPKKGASTSGNAQIGTYSGAQTKIFGGSSELFGLTFSNINDIAAFRLRLEFTSVTGTATLNSSTNQLRPVFHYTLPFSNKVYNTSGKFSITSGKVSIT